ncbi:MAG: anti-sigma factor antagonist [Phycisphaera sp.]|nr:anti-sigma factor antagonist [Phycisphaera sp.]
MKLTHEDHNQVSVLNLQGDLTHESTDHLRKLVVQMMDNNTRDFVLDVNEMEFIDSAGLEAIIWLQERCGEQLGQVRLANVQDNVNTILEITRLASRFDKHPSVESAIKSLR